MPIVWTDPIPTIQQLGGSFTRIPGNDPKFPHYNPSICWHKGKLVLTIRSCNYTLPEGDGPLYLADGGDHAHTRVLLGELDPQTLAVSHLTPLRYTHGSPLAYHGLEDARVYSRGSDLLLTGTHPWPNRCQIVECLVSRDEVVLSRQHKSPHAQPYEKNWVSTDVPTDRLHLVYSPTEVLTADGQLLSSRDTPYHRQIHLGTQLVAVPAGYRSLVHATYAVPDSDGTRRRRYLHYWAEWSTEGFLQRLSDPFTFGTGMTVEFASGLVRTDEGWLATVGVQDRWWGVARFGEIAVSEYEVDKEIVIVQGKCN